MKSSVTSLVITTLLALMLCAPSQAQEVTYTFSKSLESFDEIRALADTDVVIVKSNRNHIKLVGDSSAVFNLPVSLKEKALYIEYEENNDERLQKIVIEYKTLNRLVTGGTGSFHIEVFDEKKLDVFNNTANLIMSGKTQDVNIYSQEGMNDFSDLKALSITAYIGEKGNLKKPRWY